jgi:hypothetical protein
VRVNGRNNGLMLRPNMTPAERFSEYARALEYEAWKYRYRKDKRRKALPDTPNPDALARWWRLQQRADQSFVTAIVQLVEAFEE